jgi:RNA polymerase sigma-70 factor, ECF subfamily
MEENKIIRGCQRGEKEAFNELVITYNHFVYKFLMRLTGEEYLAEDLTQETFLKIIKNIDKYEINNKCKFSTYLLTVAKNSYLDELRRRKKFSKEQYDIQNYELPDLRVNIEEMTIDKLEGEKVIEMLKDLSIEHQTVIRLKYIEQLSLKEIGVMLDLQPKTVKSRIHNGVSKLRKLLYRSD